MSFLKDQDDDKAKAVYEGSFSFSGEVHNSAALARQFPNYTNLQADGDFSYWAHQLYGGLFNAQIISLDRQGDAP